MAHSPRRRIRARIKDPGTLDLLPELVASPTPRKGVPLTCASPLRPDLIYHRSRSSSPRRMVANRPRAATDPPFTSLLRCATETPVYASRSPGSASRSPVFIPNRGVSACDSTNSPVPENFPDGFAPKPIVDVPLRSWAKLVDIAYWVKQASDVDQVDQYVVDSRSPREGSVFKQGGYCFELGLITPTVSTTRIRQCAMSFDVLNRLADVLPDQRSIMKNLLEELHTAIFFGKGGTSVISGKYAQCRGAGLLGFRHACESIVANETESSSDSDYDIQDTRDILGNVEFASFNNSTKMSRRSSKEYRATEEGNRKMVFLQGEDRLPEKYSFEVPYFTVVQRLEEMMEVKRKQIQWMHGICGSCLGQPRAAQMLLDMTTEFTTEKSHYWLFAMWKIEVRRSAGLCLQIDMFRPKLGVITLKIFVAWLSLTYRNLESKHRQELTEREVEQSVLLASMHDLQVVKECLTRRLETANLAMERFGATFSEAFESKSVLQTNLKETKPETLRLVLRLLVEKFLRDTCDTSGLEWLSCKRQFLSKDFGFILRDNDVSLSVYDITAEQIVVRWINYLLSGMKCQATELLDAENLQKLRTFAGYRDPRDVERCATWCRVVRSMTLVHKLHDDICSGIVLTVLSASLRARRRGRRYFDPMDLWPLAELDDKARAAAALRCLHTFAPSKAFRSMLHVSDIIEGNLRVILPFLSAVLLHESPADKSGWYKSPSSSGKRRLSTDVHKKAFAWLHHDHSAHAKFSGRRKTMEAALENSAGRPDLLELAARGLRSTDDDNDEETLDSEDDSADDNNDHEEWQEKEQIFLTLETMAGPSCYEPFQDPSCLSRNGEELSDLKNMKLQDLLLRWLNMHTVELDNASSIKNLNKDLADGRVLTKVLRKVAPQLSEACGIKWEELTSSERCSHALMEMGALCVNFSSSDAQAIRAGQPDVAACFVGKLFLACPGMSPQVGSALWTHRRNLTSMARRGYALLTSAEDPHYVRVLQDFCCELKEKSEEIGCALADIAHAKKTLSILQQRVLAFTQQCSEAFVKKKQVVRFHGAGRSFHKSALRVDLSECITVSEWQSVFQSDSAVSIERSIKHACKPYIHLLQRMFLRHAGESDSDTSGIRLSLVGLMRIYRDWRLRCSCVHVPPYIAEAIYHHVRQEFAATEADGLSLEGLIRWVLRLVLFRCEVLVRLEPNRDLKVHDSLVEFFSRHVSPYSSCGDLKETDFEDEFSRVSNDPDIRSVLVAKEKQLRAIYELYSTGVAEQCQEEDENTHEMMLVDFQKLLSNAGIVKGGFTIDVIQHIFANVLARAGWHEGDMPACAAVQAGETNTEQANFSMDADAKSHAKSIKRGKGINSKSGHEKNHRGDATMSLCEFLDALVACAVYVNPNPLLATRMRVESFLRQTFMPGLEKHVQRTPSKSAKVAFAKEHQDVLIREFIGETSTTDNTNLSRIRERQALAKRRTLVRLASSARIEPREASSKHALAAHSAGTSAKGSKSPRTPRRKSNGPG